MLKNKLKFWANLVGIIVPCLFLGGCLVELVAAGSMAIDAYQTRHDIVEFVTGEEVEEVEEVEDKD
jgi:hypothetical protein